jgi:hypothetical protein
VSGPPSRKVVIDGVPYAPLGTIAQTVAPDLRRALVEAWVGEIQNPSEVDDLAASLRVVVTDSGYGPHDPTIDAFVASLQQREGTDQDEDDSSSLG